MALSPVLTAVVFVVWLALFVGLVWLYVRYVTWAFRQQK